MAKKIEKITKMSEPSNQPSSIIKPPKRAPMTSGSLPPTYPEISPSTLQTLSNYTSSQTPIPKAPAHLYHSAYASLQSTPAPKSLPPFLRCDICQQLESLDHLLILCQSCLVPVHKSCYLLDLACNPDQLHKKHKGFLITIQGFEVMVKGWTCQRCQHGFKGKCCFCKKEKGCLVKSTLEGEEIWAHVQCVYWYQSVCYQDNVMKKIIVRSHEEEQKSKPMGVCQYCKDKTAKVVSCDFLVCNKYFCVRCATNHGIIKGTQEMRPQRHPEAKQICFVFCLKHQEEGVKKVSNQDLKGLREVNSNVSFEVKDEDPTDPSEEIDLLKNLALKNNTESSDPSKQTKNMKKMPKLPNLPKGPKGAKKGGKPGRKPKKSKSPCEKPLDNTPISSRIRPRIKKCAKKSTKKGNTKPKIISDSSKKRMQKALEKELEVAQQDTSHISEPSNIDDKKDYEESKIVTSEHQSRSELPPDHIDRKEDLDVDIFDYKQANLKDLMELQRVFARDLDRRMMKQERSFELLSERIEKLDGLNDLMKEVLGKIENLEKVNQNLNTSFKDYTSNAQNPDPKPHMTQYPPHYPYYPQIYPYQQISYPPTSNPSNVPSQSVSSPNQPPSVTTQGSLYMPSPDLAKLLCIPVETTSSGTFFQTQLLKYCQQKGYINSQGLLELNKDIDLISLNFGIVCAPGDVVTEMIKIGLISEFR